VAATAAKTAMMMMMMIGTKQCAPHQFKAQFIKELPSIEGFGYPLDPHDHITQSRAWWNHNLACLQLVDPICQG